MIKKIFLIVITACFCISCSGETKLNVSKTSDMCSDYYVLTENNIDTVFVSDYEFEQGITVYYNNVLLNSFKRVDRDINTINSKYDSVKYKFLVIRYNNIKDHLTTYNPVKYEYETVYDAFYEIGLIDISIGKLIDDIKIYKLKSLN